MEVLVFKTSVKYKRQIKVLTNLLDDIGKWNFDLEDCDNILRVECVGKQASIIIKILRSNGFECEELK